VIGLSILSGAHMVLTPRIIELMRKNGLEDVKIFIGGIIPDEDVEPLKQMGVSGIFGPGANTADIAAQIRQVLNRAAESS